MEHLAAIVVFGVIALGVVWAANALVGLLSGERPRDTVTHWAELWLGFLAGLEPGNAGRAIAGFLPARWPWRLVWILGVAGALVLAARACGPAREERGGKIGMDSRGAGATLRRAPTSASILARRLAAGFSARAAARVFVRGGPARGVLPNHPQNLGS